jgi:hypothetical protein
MTVTISPQTELLLTEQAGRMGQNADTLADVLLQHALAEAAHDFEDSCAAISEALSGDPTEDMSLEQYRAQFETKRLRQAQKQEAA